MKEAANPKSAQQFWLLVDITMIGIAVANLSWMVFDSLFDIKLINIQLAQFAPNFHAFYDNKIHQNFFRYDLYFIAIFMGELCIRWAISLYQKEHANWFSYLLIHWYDLLSCIPIGSLRWLRILRIIAILYRLNRMGIINIKKTKIYRQLNHYYNIISEEVADRILIKIIDGIQVDIEKNTPIAQEIINRALLPQKQAFIEWLALTISETGTEYYINNKVVIRAGLNSITKETLKQHPDLQRIQKVPLLGKNINHTLEDIITRTLNAALEACATELLNPNNNTLQSLLNTEPKTTQRHSNLLDDQLTDIIKMALNDSLSILKEHIKVQQWKSN